MRNCLSNRSCGATLLPYEMVLRGGPGYKRRGKREKGEGAKRESVDFSSKLQTPFPLFAFSPFLTFPSPKYPPPLSSPALQFGQGIGQGLDFFFYFLAY